MTTQNKYFIFGFLPILTSVLLSCGSSNPTNPTLNSIDYEEEGALNLLLEDQMKIQSSGRLTSRGALNYDSNICPAVMVFGDTKGVAGSSCVNWDLNVKSSFVPGPLVQPGLQSIVTLLRSIFLESNDQIQATHQWDIHARTTTGAHIDGLIFSAQVNSNVLLRGTVKTCDGTKTQTISQDILMTSSNYGRIPVFDNNQNMRFLVHPNSNYCRSTVPPPTISGIRLEYRTSNEGNYQGHVRVKGDGTIVRGCSGPNVFCTDQVVAYISPSQQSWLESLINQARTGNVTTSSFHCDPSANTTLTHVRYTADNDNILLKSFTDPCGSFPSTNDSPAAVQLMQFIDLYRL